MTTQWLQSVDLGRWRRAEGHQRQRSSQSYYSVTDEDATYNPRDSYYDEKRYMPQLHPAVSTSTLKSISHQDHRHHKFYKPTSNRSLIFAVFLLVISICIGLLELARTTHYDAKDIPALETIQARNLIPKRTEIAWEEYEAGQDSASMFSTSTYKFFVEHLPATQTRIGAHNILPRQVNGFSAEADGVPTDRLSSEPFQTSVNTETPDNNVVQTDTPSPVVNEDSSTSPVTPGQPNGAGQLTVTDTPDPTTKEGGTGQPFGGGQLTVTDPGPNIVTDGNGAAETTSAEEGSTPGAPNPADQLTITDKISPTPQPSAGSQLTITSNGSPSVVTAASQTSKKTFSIASIVSGSLIASGNSVIATVPITSLASTGVRSTTGDARGALTLSNSQGKATATVSFTGAAIQTNSNGIATATVSYTVSSDPKPTQEGSVLSNKSSAKSLSFTQFDYFLAMYLPSMLCVMLVSGWLIVSATFKMMEPFYQMATLGGGTAQSTLSADYFTNGLSFSFVRAALDGHWVMLLAGTVQLFLAIILFLAPESMHVVPTAYCKTEISDTQPCHPVWVVDTPIIRGMEVFLVGCFSLIITILVLNRRRVSGVYSDPSKIATMADILVHKPLIQELRDIPSTATKAEIEIDLRESRYMLGTFVEDDRQQYGIIKLENDSASNLTSEPRILGWWRRVSLSIENMQDNVHKHWPYLLDIISLALCFVLFMLILIYRVMPDASLSKPGFNTWMSSGHRGPKFVLNGIAVTIGFLVKRRERILRLSHPYVLMAKKPQPASECITAGTRATQFTSVTGSAKGGNVSLALLSLAAIFTDVLLILTPGIPQTAAQTKPVYRASTICCLTLLGFIGIAMARVTFKSWRRGPHVECPDTLAAVLMRLCASQFIEEKNMAADEQDHLIPSFGEDDEHKQRRRYEGLNGERRYRFGCMEGVDGVQRYMVDEDVWARRAALDLGMQIGLRTS